MLGHSRISPVLVALLAAGLLSGCGKGTDTLSPTIAPAEVQNENAVTGVLAEVPALAEDELFLSEEQTELGLAANAALGRVATPAAAIRPWRYWRLITDVQRSFEFDFFAPDSNGDPTRAFVTIHKRLTGTFNIATPTDTSQGDGGLAAGGSGPPPDPSAMRIVRKPLEDHWVRRVAMVRIDSPGGDRHLWRIAGTSGVQVRSVPPPASVRPQARILSLRVQTAGLDTTITDPLEIVRLRQIMRLLPGEEVTLTATTAAEDDIVVLIHRGMRFRFHNNGDGTQTGRWLVPAIAGIHHFGVNALSHGTLFDDEAPYDSDAWLLPYVTVPLNVDQMP